MTADQGTQPLTLFISYAHEDAAFLREFGRHLRALVEEGLIKRWDDREILPGVDWENDIDETIEAADMMVVLVSSASIDSRYVMGREVRRACERADAKHPERPFFLVPVVIRAVDWETLPLGRQNALPTGAVPVATWDDQDVAWLDVVRGIRRIVESVRPKTAEIKPVTSGPVVAVGTNPIVPQPERRPAIRRWLVGSLAVLVPVLALSWLAVRRWSEDRSDCSECQSQVRQGNAFAGIGRPTDARLAFERASRQCPGCGDAKWGLEKVAVWEGKPREPKVAFERRVQSLFDRAPADAYANLLIGDLAYTHGDLEAAMRHYFVAASDELMAQAHFGKGAIYERRGQYQEALLAYRQASLTSRSTPRYRSNGAGMLIRLGKLDEAAVELSSIDGYPLAKAELGKLLVMNGQLDEAAAQLRQGVDLQDDASVAQDAENRGRWSFRVDDTKHVEFGEPRTKRCYLQTLLAVVQAWRLDDSESDAQARKVKDDCSPSRIKLQSVVESELRPLAKDAARSEALSRVLASIWERSAPKEPSSGIARCGWRPPWPRLRECRGRRPGRRPGRPRGPGR